MKQTFDTDTILFQTLTSSNALKTAMTGGVYKRQRPLNSKLEDIVVNTIVLSQTYEPQFGTSNINIHVPDKAVTIAGVQQLISDESRMEYLSDLVLELIRSISVPGLLATLESQTVIEDAETKQHFVNIRLTWNIHN